MKHKGIQYHIVQTAGPIGWKWTIDLGGKARSGTAPSREAGRRLAEREIDRALALQEKRRNLTELSLRSGRESSDADEAEPSDSAQQ